MTEIGKATVQVKVENDAILAEILTTLKNIEEALKPKTYEVSIDEGKTWVLPEATPEYAQRVAEQLKYAWGVTDTIHNSYKDEDPKPETYRTKEVRNLNRGDRVRFHDDQEWNIVSRVLPLAHGDVWLYDAGGDIIARVKGTREAQVKVTP